MKKAITKSILCLILALSIALPSFYLAVENVLRVYGITNAYCYWRESDYYIGNFSGITLSKKDFNKKYHAIKSELSKNPDFIDLIPQICADQLIDCGGEKAKIEYSAYSPYPGYEMQSAQITNQKAYYDGKTEVYYDALKECEYIEIVEGRAIDTSKNYKQGDIMEIMTDESCPFPLNSKLYIALCLSDSENRQIVVPATIVGKAKCKGITPLSNINATESYSERTVYNGKKIYIPNLADAFDISKNTESDFSSINLMALYSEAHSRYTKEEERAWGEEYTAAVIENGGVLTSQPNLADLTTWVRENMQLKEYFALSVFHIFVLIATLSVYGVKQKNIIKNYKKEN